MLNSRGQRYRPIKFSNKSIDPAMYKYGRKRWPSRAHSCKEEVKDRDDIKSITYLRQCVGATGQLLLVLKIIAGGLAWPTTGAEVRPWFLFPQRWPPTGTLPYPGIPGCGPLSLQARRENISRFLSSHFIIIASNPSRPLDRWSSYTVKKIRCSRMGEKSEILRWLFST